MYWLVLSSLTLVYLWMGASDPSGGLRANATITASAIVLALVKVRIIIRELMEVRSAPALLRRVTDAWVLLMAACLLGSYFFGMSST